MHAASDRQSSYLRSASLRSRIISALLAAVPTGLIILMLLAVSALGPRPRETKPLVVTFNLKPPPPPERARSVVKVENASHASAPHQQKVPPLNMVMLTRQDYAASDIAVLPSHKASGVQGTDAGSDSGTSDGPGGEKMYDVAWYREPTHAELAPYLPATGPEVGSAVIACRMIEKFHVEDCRELGESPSGSGLSRALRLAAWQFLVRPPRIGGRSILGGWVRIRFEFTAKRDGDEAGTGGGG
jgi:hypothetical protein